MNRMILAGLAIAAGTLAGDARSAGHADQPDIVTVELRQEDPFAVTIQSAGIGILPGCEAFQVPIHRVRFENRGVGPIWIDEWSSSREGPWRLEEFSADDGAWRRLPVLYTGPRERVEIEADQAHDFLLVVGWGEERVVNVQALRLVLDYCDDPARLPVDRKRVTLPVRLLPGEIEKASEPDN